MPRLVFRIIAWPLSPAPWLLGFLNMFYGVADNIQGEIRVREHGHMAAVDWMCAGSHTFCQETLEVRMNRVVVVGHYVPTRFSLPSGAWSLFGEKLGARCVMRRPHELLVLFGKIPSEVLGTIRL